MANVSKLLYTTVDDDCLLLAINPKEETKIKLLAARTKIRNRLRDKFKKHSSEKFGEIIIPRFFTQGSYSYKTINHPANPPKQQMDLDDGCYLPLSFLKTEKRPSIATTIFFEFVDSILYDLAVEMGWTFVKKPTCSRMIICSESHIDIPLYAIPDCEFLNLDEAALSSNKVTASVRKKDDWSALPEDKVLLAHRVDDWKISDPRQIHTWFLEAVDIYGERLRRICRYLKAWRDHHSPELDNVSSILLMVCVWQAFEDKGLEHLPAREDQLLLVSLNNLHEYLNKDVCNPTAKNEIINRISLEDRKKVAAKALAFKNEFQNIVTNCWDSHQAVETMIASFGSRMPNRTDLVSGTDDLAQSIRAQPKKVVAAPIVGRSQSG